MNQIKFCVVLLLIILIIFSVTVPVYAMDIGFSTEEVSQDAAESFIKNIGITKLTDEPPTRPIKRFAVRSDGTFALCYQDGNEKTIVIYDKNGVFQYGFSCVVPGSIAIEWEQDNLVIAAVRDDLAVSVTSQGEIAEVYKIPQTPENNSHWQTLLYQTECTVGDSQYALKNHFGVLSSLLTSYSKLTVVDESGTETVLYSTGKGSEIGTLIVIVSIVLLCVIAIIGIVCRTIKNRETELRRREANISLTTKYTD